MFDNRRHYRQALKIQICVAIDSLQILRNIYYHL